VFESEIRARNNKDKKVEETVQDNGEELKVKENISYRAVNAILPISVLVVSMFYFIFSSGQGDTIKDILGTADTFSALMHSTLLSAFVATILSVGQRILSLNETFEAWYNGLKFMMMGLLVLVLAWALADISKELHTADYIVSILGDKIPIQILPTVVFFIAAVTAFGSGSSWGVMAILMPHNFP
jgi:Na+/H+ antiporter NhaC